ncbi:MAG: hypothetical protein HW403_804 [Dehalococcoidia bacterium]|nr:hypothetical protein [Dehalococcoidia bacterium]
MKYKFNLTLLQILTVVLAVLFLVVLDLLRHKVFFGLLHTTRGFISTYIATAIGVAIFSWAVFGLIKRLEGQLMEQNRLLAALNRVAASSAQNMQLQQLLDVTLDNILETMGIESGIIRVLDQEDEELVAVCHRGFSDDFVQKIRRAKLAENHFGEQVAPSAQPVVLESLFEDTRVGEAAREEGIRSSLAVRLVAGGEVTGLLAIASRDLRRFHPLEVDILTNLGTQLGMAVRNSVLYENAQRTSKEMSTLLAVGKATSSSLLLDELLTRGLDITLEVMGVEWAEVWLVEGQEVVMKAHRGAAAEAFLERTRFKLGEGFPGIVARTGNPLIAHHLPEERWFLREGVKKAGFNTFGAWPLINQGRILGVFAVASRLPEALTRPSELRLLNGIREHIAVAIDNALLYGHVLGAVPREEQLGRP